MYIPNIIVKSVHVVFLQGTPRDGAQGNLVLTLLLVSSADEQYVIIV
jgi:hypothetical protein